MDALTTFSDARECERAVTLSARLGIDHQVVSPSPAYELVGCPAIRLSAAAKAAFLESGGADIVSSGGWTTGSRRTLGRPRRREAPPRTSSGASPSWSSATASPIRLGCASSRTSPATWRGPPVPQRRVSSRLLRADDAGVHRHGRAPHGLALPRPHRDRQGGRHRRRLGQPGAGALPRERRVGAASKIIPSTRPAAGRRRSRSASACRAPTAASAASPPCTAFAWAWCTGVETPGLIAAHRASSGEHGELRDALLADPRRAGHSQRGRRLMPGAWVTTAPLPTPAAGCATSSRPQRARPQVASTPYKRCLMKGEAMTTPLHRLSGPSSSTATAVRVSCRSATRMGGAGAGSPRRRTREGQRRTAVCDPRAQRPTSRLRCQSPRHPAMDSSSSPDLRRPPAAAHRP